MDFHPRLNMLLCSCLNQATQSLRLGGARAGGRAHAAHAVLMLCTMCSRCV